MWKLFYNLSMSDIFKSIKYFFLSLKEKSLQEKLKHTTKRSFTNKTSKTIFGSSVEVNINTQTQGIIAKVKEDVTTIINKVNCDPNELLNYIKAAKTPVYKLANADKLLAVIKEEEGLIYEQKGFAALYLSIITGRGIEFKTPPMFILRDGEIDKYYMLHNFYRWFSLKSDLPGFEYDVQKKFKKFIVDESDNLLKSFSMEDIISLKEAIARDQEASEFVINYTKAQEGSKKVLDKIKNDGGANI